MDIEETIETKILREKGVGLGKDSIKEIPEGMREVVVDLDQVQELILVGQNQML